MDKELRKDVEQLAQAKRLEEEEALHGENIAKGIELQEEVEEKERYLSKLKKLVKVWRGIFLAGLFTLICILLYACAQAKLTETTVAVEQEVIDYLPQITPTPTSIPTPTPVPETYEKHFWFMLEEPQLRCEDLQYYSVDEALNIASVDGYDYYTYYPEGIGSSATGIPLGDINKNEKILVSYADISTLLKNTQANYSLVLEADSYADIESALFEYKSAHDTQYENRVCLNCGKHEQTTVIPSVFSFSSDLNRIPTEPRPYFVSEVSLNHYINYYCLCNDGRTMNGEFKYIYSDEPLDEQLLKDTVQEYLNALTFRDLQQESMGYYEFTVTPDVVWDDLYTEIKKHFPSLRERKAPDVWEGKYNYGIFISSLSWNVLGLVYEQGLY